MTRIDKKRHVDAWLNGNISREEYCQEHGISLSAFKRWIASYAYLSNQTRSTGVTSKQAIPVTIEPFPSGSAGSIELRTPSGYVLVLGADHEPFWLAEFVRRLG